MREMRRKDRQMDEEFAYSVIDRTDFGTLATISEDGTPYCIPLSIARKDRALYFHAALEGHKIENIIRNPKVCVSFACGVSVPPADIATFTTEYESAVVFGTASILEDPEERLYGLRLICEKLTPESMPFFENASQGGLPAACIVRIDINEISGKRLKYDSIGKELKRGQ